MGAPLKEAAPVVFRPKDRPTEQQHEFVRQYLANGRNAPLAYATVYGQGWKPGDEPTQGQATTGRRYLKKPKIMKLLAEAEAKVYAVTERFMERYAISQERVLHELARIAFSTQTDLVSWDSINGITVKDSADLSEDVKSSIIEVSETESKDGTKKVKVKMADKRAALETLAKHLGILNEKDKTGPTMAVQFIISKE